MTEPTAEPRPTDPNPGAAADVADVADPTRRQFFRRFAGDVFTSAAQVVGVVTELRDRSAAEAAVLLSDPGPGAGPGETPASVSLASAPPDPGTAGGTAPTGFRTPFRFESDNVLLVIDQRKLPDAMVEVPVRSASDAANAIRLMIVRGAPAIGQVAAIGLALTAGITAKSQAHARRAPLCETPAPRYSPT